MSRRRTLKDRGAPRAGRAARPDVESVERLRELEANPGAGAILTGGDLDADWERAASSGEEAVGGSVATPDQNVVDQLGQALGVARVDEAEVCTSEEILRERDRRYWDLERKAAGDPSSS
jgi:Family of unknown function (DUF6335)